MDYIEVASFADIADEFLARVHRIVWCTVATVDTRDRPRSRILHTLWEGEGEGPTAVGWVATRRHTLKAAHLARNPYVSLAYSADIARPVYADCRAQWVDDLAAKQRIWALFLAAPPPLGYDPAPIFERPDHPDFGVLQFTPWRIEVTTVPHERKVWHRPVDESGALP